MKKGLMWSDRKRREREKNERVKLLGTYSNSVHV
jgi:hypothetical protein